MVRALLADGRIERVDGTYRPTGDVSTLTVPNSLRSLIMARLDALEPGDRALLQDAAVLGQVFSVAALSAVRSESADELEAPLRRVVRRELLEVETDPRSPERGQYKFMQALIREVAYDTLGRRERRARHLAVARHNEMLGDQELAAALATHYLAVHAASAAGAEADAVAAQARLALRAAAERAASLGSNDQAVTHLEQALTVTTDPAEGAELMEQAADSANAAAQSDVAESYARRAMEAHRQAGDEVAAARSAALLGEVLLDASEIQRAIEVLEAAVAELPASAAEEAQAALLATLARGHMRNENPSEAVSTADQALVLAERLNLEKIAVEALINKGSSLNKLGRRREATALLDAAIRLSAAGGWISAELRARNNLGTVSIEDDPARSMAIVRDGAELAKRVGNRAMFCWLAGTAAGNAYFAGEDWGAALQLVDEALSTPAGPADRARLLEIAGFIAAAREGQLPALAEIEELVQSRPNQLLSAGLDWLRAEIALLSGDFERAYDGATRGARVYAGFAELAGPVAIRSAIWESRPESAERARRVAEFIDAQPPSGAFIQAHRAAAWAAVAVLEGRRAEALAGFRGAIGSFRRFQLWWEVARYSLDALIAMPDEPEVQSWTDEARAIFERLGARLYLERLDAALAPAAGDAGAGAPAASAPRTTGDLPAGRSQGASSTWGPDTTRDSGTGAAST